MYTGHSGNREKLKHGHGGEASCEPRMERQVGVSQAKECRDAGEVCFKVRSEQA